MSSLNTVGSDGKMETAETDNYRGRYIPAPKLQNRNEIARYATLLNMWLVCMGVIPMDQAEDKASVKVESGKNGISKETGLNAMNAQNKMKIYYEMINSVNNNIYHSFKHIAGDPLSFYRAVVKYQIDNQQQLAYALKAEFTNDYVGATGKGDTVESWINRLQERANNLEALGERYKVSDEDFKRVLLEKLVTKDDYRQVVASVHGRPDMTADEVVVQILGASLIAKQRVSLTRNARNEGETDGQYANAVSSHGARKMPSICHSFLNNGSCRFGGNCKFMHVVEAKAEGDHEGSSSGNKSKKSVAVAKEDSNDPYAQPYGYHSRPFKTGMNA